MHVDFRLKRDGKDVDITQKLKENVNLTERLIQPQNYRFQVKKSLDLDFKLTLDRRDGDITQKGTMCLIYTTYKLKKNNQLLPSCGSPLWDLNRSGKTTALIDRFETACIP